MKNKEVGFGWTAICIIIMMFTIIGFMLSQPEAKENRFTESAKKSVEIVNGRTEREEEERLLEILKELNDALEEINHPATSYPLLERYKKALAKYGRYGGTDYDDLLYCVVDLELQVEALHEYRKEHKEDIDTLLELMAELEERVVKLEKQKGGLK